MIGPAIRLQITQISSSNVKLLKKKKLHRLLHAIKSYVSICVICDTVFYTFVSVLQLFGAAKKSVRVVHFDLPDGAGQLGESCAEGSAHSLPDNVLAPDSTTNVHSRFLGVTRICGTACKS